MTLAEVVQRIGQPFGADLQQAPREVNYFCRDGSLVLELHQDTVSEVVEAPPAGILPVAYLARHISTHMRESDVYRVAGYQSFNPGIESSLNASDGRLGVLIQDGRVARVDVPNGVGRSSVRRVPARHVLYMVPLGDYPAADLEDLAAYLHDKLGIEIKRLPSPPRDETVVDHSRRQLIAERLIDLVKRTYPREAADQGAVIIGVTRGDMYTTSENWQYAYAVNDGDRCAVVATWRMDPAHIGQRPLEMVESVRARKMVMKHIGELYYGLPASSDPHSLMYSPVLGPDDLDAMFDKF